MILIINKIIHTQGIFSWNTVGDALAGWLQPNIFQALSLPFHSLHMADNDQNVEGHAYSVWKIGSDHMTQPSCIIAYGCSAYSLYLVSWNYQAKIGVFPLCHLHIRYNCFLVVRTVGRKHNVGCSNPHTATGLFNGCCFSFSPWHHM